MRRTRGFTLVEMLVVVVIIGVMVVGAVLAITAGGEDRELDRESRRLAALIDYARERAELETRDYGLRFNRAGYDFAVFDVRTALWEPARDEDLRARELPDGLELALVVEGRPLVLDARPIEADARPQIAVLSSGEISGFEVALRRIGTENRVRLRLGDDDRVEAVAPAAAVAP